VRAVNVLGLAGRWAQLAGLGLVPESQRTGGRLQNFDLHVDGALAEFRRAFR
jgi:hypothetical protein